MKKTMALMIGLLVLGFAFAAAQTTEEPKEPAKTGVASQIKNAGVVQPKLMHRVQWVSTWLDADADGIADEGETTIASPKGDITALKGTARTWEPFKRLDYVDPETVATDATTVSDIDLISEPAATTTVDSTAVTLTKSGFRKGLGSTGLTEGAGVPKGPAARVLAQKARG